MHRIALLGIVVSLFSSVVFGQDKPLDLQPKLVHLRNEPVREWSSFPEQAEATRLETRFAAKPNETEVALRIRQEDVKQLWRVLLNDKPLGELQRDEADMIWYLPIPPKSLRDGENILLIEAKSSAKPVADDIRVGELRIEPRPVNDVLTVAQYEIEVRDRDTNANSPARITIVTKSGTLQQTSAKSNHELAVRPGVIYTATGRASFSLPAGEYVVYAGRGFEYSLAKMELKAIAGETVRRTLEIRREVPTPGFVACDTHIHTLTHSGHGDATIEERMITLAGEGIELPIATDHNKHIDYRPTAANLGVDKHFTPVMGNEVTTSVGHFNVFPVADGARVPNHQLKEWNTIFPEIFATPGVRVCILNHTRDIHSNTRPFGPDLFNATIGENFTGWPMQFNAMEVINSGATRSETLGLLHDWMAVLNRGYQVTPVGCSDSHDVSRYIVGQGRTYIRCPDADVGKLDAETAVKNFLDGRVAVSYGLLVDLTLNGKFQPGDLATAADDEVVADIRVLGPHWTRAREVQFYANGRLLREEPITPPADRERAAGVQWQGTWRFPRPKHDAHFVAVALGDDIDGLYWATAKPYQPTSTEFKGQTLGMSGAVWLDVDGDGQRSSPRAYAEKLIKDAGGDIEKLAAKLKSFDEAVAAQATHLYLTQTKTSDNRALEQAIARSDPHVGSGMRKAWQAFRDQEIARAKSGSK